MAQTSTANASVEPSDGKVEVIEAERTGVHSVIVVDSPTGRESVRFDLVCVSGADLGRTFRIGLEPVVIGRGAVDIELSPTEISRQHARIKFDDGTFVLEDLGSVNGTFLNGRRVEGSAPMRVGDHVQVGSTVLVFAQRNELEERMQRVQRLEAMGALAGGLAHDFNNMLAVIITNLDFVEEALPPDARDGREALDAIRHAAQSGASLAKRLVRLGSTDPLTFQLVPMSTLVEAAVMQMRRLAGSRIAVSCTVEPGLKILGSYEELHQVLHNLMINARDAMPDGGKLKVEARARDVDVKQAVELNLPSGGHYVELVVTDTGSGMDPATLARAFEPFFTTKPRGKGSSLGLAMIHGCVRRHGGTIDVDSKVGRGTTFRLLFQRAPSAPKATDSDSPKE